MTLSSRGGDQTGFTLLELLVALAVFAVMAAAAYGGLQSVLRARAVVEVEAKRLAELQMAMHILESDMAQVANRGIRDEYGEPRAALVGTSFDTALITFTRAGWNNPLDRDRATLQRLTYRLEDRRLVRGYWNTLDRGSRSEPRETTLLEQVERVEIRFLDEQNVWQGEWLPVDGDDNTAPLPKAVELTVTLSDWGNITRLFPLPTL